MRWSFEIRIGGESDKKLFDSFSRIREGLGIADRDSKMQMYRAQVDQWDETYFVFFFFFPNTKFVLEIYY